MSYEAEVSLSECMQQQNIFLAILSEAKLNPLQAQWPMELALISGFCSVKRMRVFDSWMGH